MQTVNLFALLKLHIWFRNEDAFEKQISIWSALHNLNAVNLLLNYNQQQYCDPDLLYVCVGIQNRMVFNQNYKNL